MRVCVRARTRTCTRAQLIIEISPAATLAELKEMIQDRTNIEMASQVLVYQASPLA